MDDDGRAIARSEDAALVELARGDDPDSFGRLYDRWFDRVHDLAYRITRDDAAAADVAQDAFVAAWSSLERLEDPYAFGGWLLRITRNTALDRQRREGRTQATDAETMAMIERAGSGAVDAPAGFGVEDRLRSADDPVSAIGDAEIAALVWEAAEALGERDAELLDLTVRHELSPAELAEVVGISRNAANQAVHRVRTRLRSAIEARVLWHGGDPRCAVLGNALEAAGVTRFGGEAVRVTSEHVEDCELCTEQRALKLEPSALFAATPFIIAPMLKMQVAHALSGSVPMGASQAVAGASGSVGASGVEVVGPSPEQVLPPSRRPPNHRPGGPHRPWHQRRSFWVPVALVLATLAIVIAGIVAFAGSANEAPSTAPVVSSTTLPKPTLDNPDPKRPTNVAPVPNTATPGSAVTGSIDMAPASLSSPYDFPSGAPTLDWETAGAASVQVSGPGVSSTATSGSQPVCPGLELRGECSAASGVYTYELVARNASGTVVLDRTTTLTIS